MHKPQAGEAPRQDFLIPGPLEKLHGLLRILFHKGDLLFREHPPMGKRQMPQSFPLFLRIAGGACHLAHHLKIGNGLIVFGLQHPDEATSLIHREEPRRIQGRDDPAHSPQWPGYRTRSLPGWHRPGGPYRLI